MTHRRSRVERATSETRIDLSLDLDGSGAGTRSTSIGFFDHMLDAFARHGRFDLEVRAHGDLHVDFHHTVEDVGIALGQAFDQALGDRAGIVRYGSIRLPMDESLASASIDVSGRGLLVYRHEIAWERIGDFPIELAEEFFRALAHNAKITLHLAIEYGHDPHHRVEALFKACARAFHQATRIDPSHPGIPSTKGTLA